MFEVSSMIHREQETLAVVSSKASENMERYQKALADFK